MHQRRAWIHPVAPNTLTDLTPTGKRTSDCRTGLAPEQQKARLNQ